MRPRRAALISRARILLFAGIGTGALVAAACGLSTGGTGENVGEHPDTGTPFDATVGDEPTASDGGVPADGSVFDAPGADSGLDADAGVIVFDCNDAGVTSCAECAGKPTVCAATGACVAQCSTDCPDARVACFRCTGGGATVTGTCEQENDAGYCMNGAYAPGAACPCFTKDASTCPGDFQMCIDAGAGYACHSCGEPGTGGQVCKGGMGAQKCDFGGNAADHLTCH